MGRGVCERWEEEEEEEEDENVSANKKLFKREGRGGKEVRKKSLRRLHVLKSNQALHFGGWHDREKKRYCTNTN